MQVKEEPELPLPTQPCSLTAERYFPSLYLVLGKASPGDGSLVQHGPAGPAFWSGLLDFVEESLGLKLTYNQAKGG